MPPDTSRDLLRTRRSRAARAVVVSMAMLVSSATTACSSGKEPPAASRSTETTQSTASDPSSTAPEPARSEGYPTQPEGVEWPTRQWPTGPIGDGVDATAVDRIVERAFGELSNDTGTIDAILVVQGGRLVLERYNNWDPEATHNSWSMAKSINSALVGILVGQGKVDIEEPFPAPEWQTPGDPRAAITWDQLLRMSSGLAWDEDYGAAGGDVVSTLGPDNDRAAYAASKPLANEPGSTWSYSTGTANLLARGVADIVGHGDALVGWIDQELMGPLGIPKVKHNVDRTGVISGGSFIDLRPQDFARFGLLYARGGVWEGRRILPEGWVDYTRKPTPSNPEGTYGAQWWLKPDRPTMFYASGFNGQTISVVPDRDLVVVVLSNAGDNRDEQVQLALLDAFGG